MLFEPLRALVAVAHHRSVRKASISLHLAPSSVTRQLHLLENLLRVTLFERSTDGMRLTPAGQLAYDYARATITSLDSLRADLGEMKDGSAGTVRVAVVESVVSSPLMDAIAQFRRLHPRVVFDLHVLPSPAVVEAAGRGDADFGITFNQPARPGVLVETLVREPVCLALAPGQAFEATQPLHVAALVGLPLAMPNDTYGIRRDIDRAATERRVTLAPVLEANSFEALRAFARSGAGGALLPETSLLRDVQNGTLAAFPLTDQALSGTSLQMVTSGAGPPSSLVRRFIEVTREAMTRRA